MIAARSHGLAAIAVPGTQAWQPSWANLLAGRRVTVIMDCDQPGREAARRVADDLARYSAVRVVDLDPSREDGYDLTDALLKKPGDVMRTAGGEPPQRVRSAYRQVARRGVER
jgi:DNA primase